jgi:hypothetical protein
MDERFLAIVVCMILVVILNIRKECLEIKPSEAAKIKLANSVVNNQHLFSGTTGFKNARNKLPWLDAVTYEDSRLLSRDGKLNINNVSQILS